MFLSLSGRERASSFAHPDAHCRIESPPEHVHIIRCPFYELSGPYQLYSAQIPSTETEVFRVDECASVFIVATPHDFTFERFLQCTLGEQTGLWLDRMLSIVLLRSEDDPDSSSSFLSIGITFISELEATEFIFEVNGRRFSSTHPEVCHAVRFFGIHASEHDKGSLTEEICRQFPDPGCFDESRCRRQYRVLPRCPFCLERLDSSITGIEGFVPYVHDTTVGPRPWLFVSCPVCTALESDALSEDFSTPINTCSDCGTNDDLWYCIVCGECGCGRYAGGHSLQHFENTGHCFAIEKSTLRVWDYTSDAYVHRILSIVGNFGIDGLFFPLNLIKKDGLFARSSIADRKMDDVLADFEHVFAAQLIEQQRYFEGTISQIQMHHASALGSLEQKAREKAAEKKKLVHDISHLERERTRLLQTMEHVRVETEEVEKCMKEIEELLPEAERKRQRAEIACNVIRTKQEIASEKVSKELSDLEAEIYDIRFHLSANDKLESSQSGGGFFVVTGGSSETLSSKNSSGSRSARRPGGR